MNRDIETYTRLIAALAENTKNRMWASDILINCRMIREAVEQVEQIARSREGGER